jgi:hypothetical protein
MIAHTTEPSGRGVTLGDIEKLTAALADTSTALDDTLANYEAELQDVNEKFLRPLKRLATATAQAEAELHAAIQAAPHLFVKPRTLNLHGFKIGYTISEGKLVWDDEDLVVKLLKKKFPDQTESLISTKETPNKDAIKALSLSSSQLAALGCAIEDAGDQVLIKRAAGDVEKLITKLKTKLVEAIVEAA